MIGFKSLLWIIVKKKLVLLNRPIYKNSINDIDSFKKEEKGYKRINSIVIQ